MNAKLCTLVLCLFFAVQGFSRPIFTIPQRNGTTGETVCLDVQVRDFTNIGTLNLTIQLNSIRHSFLNIQNFRLPGLNQNNFTRNGESIDFAWTSDTAVTLPNGTSLFQICFRVENNCEILSLQLRNLFVATAADRTANVSGGYNGGVILNTRCPFSTPTTPLCPAVLISNTSGNPGDTVCVDVSVEDVAAVSTMKFSIGFNPQKLQFVSVGNFSLRQLDTFAFRMALVNSGMVAVSWGAPNLPVGETIPDGTKIFSLCFVVKGTLGDTAVLNFINGIEPIEFRNNAFRTLNPTLISGQIKFERSTPSVEILQLCKENTGCINDRDGKIEIAVRGGKAPYTYQWTGTDNYTSIREDILALRAGEYRVTVTDSEGRTATAGPFTIVQQTNLIAINTANPVLCNKMPLQLQTTVDSSVNNYNWSSKKGLLDLSCTNCPSPVIMRSPTLKEIGVFKDTLQAVVTSSKGCRDTTFAVITIRNYAIFEKTELFVCQGDTLVLNENNQLPASGTFRWQGPNGFNSNQPTIRISNIGLEQSGNYTFTYNDTSGCIYQEVINVNVLQQPVIVSARIVPAICGPVSVSDGIFLKLSPSIGGYTVTWSSGVSYRSDTLTIANLIYLAVGNYGVTITNAAGCSLDTTFTVPPGSSLQAAVTTTGSCGALNGGTAAVTLSGGIPPYKIRWSSGDTTIAVNRLAPGTHSVTITDGTGCTENKTFSITGTAFTRKTAGAFYRGFPGSVQLTARALNAQSIRWEPADQIVNGTSFTATPDPDSVITIYTAIISDGQGCEVKDSAVVVKGPVPFLEPRIGSVEFGDTLEWCSALIASADPIGYEIRRVLTVDVERLIQTNIKADIACMRYNTIGLSQGLDTLIIEICRRQGGPCQVFQDYVTASQVLVFPGDTNDDGVVNHVDLLNIGLANDATGPNRIGEGTFWTGRSARLWQQRTPVSNTNYAHIDANGDGRIQPTDTTTVKLYWGNTHNFANLQSPVHIEPRNIGAPLFIGGGNLKKGEIARLPIVLGDATTPATNAYGTAFTIDYDAAIFDTASVSLEFVNSWLGVPNQDFISLYKNFGSTGKIEAAITRLNQKNVNGSGIIGYLNCKVRADVIGTPKAQFAVEKPVLISVQETPIPVQPLTTESNVITNVQEQWLAAQIQLFPNPTNDVLFIQTDNLKIESLQCFNAHGQLLKTYGNVQQISIADLPTGVYALRLVTDKGVASKRFVVKK